jgi:hypothetical protein
VITALSEIGDAGEPPTAVPVSPSVTWTASEALEQFVTM